MRNPHQFFVLLLLFGTWLTAPEFLRADGGGLGANAEVMDDGPGFMAFGLLLVILIFVFCLALVMALVALALIALLVAIGIVSSSVLVAFITRRPGAGLRVFFIQLGVVLGALSGIAVSGLIVWFLDLGIGLKWSSIVGVIGGLSAGAGCALLVNITWSRAVRWLVARYRVAELGTTDPPAGRLHHETGVAG